MPTIPYQQQTIFYAQHHVEKPAYHLILIHGAGGSHLVWPAAWRRLPEVDVLALDLPGHGRSGGEGRETIEAYAEAVIHFISALELENVVLVGHSMGGAIAQNIAAKQLPAVSAMVLVGTGAKLRVSPTILEAIQTNFDEAVTTINQFAWTAETPTQLVTRGRELIANTSNTVMYQDFKACDLFDMRAQLSDILMPTLVIVGSLDKLTPGKYGRFLAEQISHAQFVQLDGAGHMMMLEKPTETAEIITRFLKEIRFKD